MPDCGQDVADGAIQRATDLRVSVIVSKKRRVQHVSLHNDLSAN